MPVQHHSLTSIPATKEDINDPFYWVTKVVHVRGNLEARVISFQPRYYNHSKKIFVVRLLFQPGVDPSPDYNLPLTKAFSGRITYPNRSRI